MMIRCNLCGGFIVNLKFMKFGMRCVWCLSTDVHRAIGFVTESLDFSVEKKIHELSSKGAFVRYIRHRYLNCSFSEYFPDLRSGEYRKGVRCEDVQALSFSDDIFALITSTEVFEHVPDDCRGFREVERVLMPGGHFIFTVPLNMKSHTIERAAMKEDGTIQHLLPPEYHDDRLRGRGRVLAFRNYGNNIVEKLGAAGLTAKIVKVNQPEYSITKQLVVVSKKINPHYQEKLVSVIMPLYNAETYVVEAIDSIINQTYKNIELIIVDDKSSDMSVEIVERVAQSDNRIRLFRNESNLGIAKNRNKAIREARGEYIACLDNDDVALPERIEKQVCFFENNPDYALVASDLEIIDEHSRVVATRVYPHDNDEIHNCLSRMNPIANPASMFRRSAFQSLGGSYDESVCPVEDYEFVIRVAQRFKIANLKHKLTRYRITNTQVKSVYLKKTLRTTLLIQEKALASGLKDSFYNKIVRMILRCLLLLPDRFIIHIFKSFIFSKV